MVTGGSWKIAGGERETRGSKDSIRRENRFGRPPCQKVIGYPAGAPAELQRRHVLHPFCRLSRQNKTRPVTMTYAVDDRVGRTTQKNRQSPLHSRGYRPDLESDGEGAAGRGRRVHATPPPLPPARGRCNERATDISMGNEICCRRFDSHRHRRGSSSLAGFVLETNNRRCSFGHVAGPPEAEIAGRWKKEA